MKYGVGLLLATFGTFWAIEGLGVFTDGRESLEWPGGDWALAALLGAGARCLRLTIRTLRRAVPAGAA